MTTDFLKKLTLAAIETGYTAKEGSVVLQKIEVATLVALNIIDANNQLYISDLSKADTVYKQNAQALLDHYQNIAIVHIIVDDKPFVSWPGSTEAYTGQRAYSLFWHIDISTGQITTAPGQPKNIFGLNKLLKNALSTGAVSIKATEKKHFVPVITMSLIAINAVILILMYIEGYPNDPWVPLRFGAILPALVWQGQWYRLFTAIFIHFGIAHFGANMTALLIFGMRMEKHFGRIKFLAVFLLTGIAGSFASLFFTQGYAAGESGAIYGLIGTLFSYTRFTGKTVEALNWYIMFIFIAAGLGMGFMVPNIDNFAHIGGLLAGALFGFILSKME